MAAIENVYSPILWTDKESDQEDIQRILKRKNQKNELNTLSEVDVKTTWKRQQLEQVQKLTPILTVQEIRKWCLGPYALTLAKPYLKHSSELKYWVHKTKDNIF